MSLYFILSSLIPEKVAKKSRLWYDEIANSVLHCAKESL